MTVATRDGFGTSRFATPNPWRRLWQVPLLFLGLVVFAWGIRALVRTIRPVPFEDQAAAIQSLVTAEHYPRAIDEINRVAPYYTQPLQQGTLQALAGDALFLSQDPAAGVVRANYERALEHYQKALALGFQPTVEMNERWGQAAMVLGQPRVAMQKLEAAIAASGNDHALMKRHVRELVTAYLDAGQGAQAMALANQLLAALPPAEHDDLESMDNRAWALCKRVEIALAGGPEMRSSVDSMVEEAQRAVPTFRERDPGGCVLVWIGRAELEQASLDAAQRDLAEARSRFAVHHMNDGRAAVLLGRIAEVRGELPQALALYQEVVTGHAGTSLWAAARLGRAQVTVLRGDYASEQAVSDYRFVVAEIRDAMVPVGKRPEMVSREGLRQSLLESFQRSSNAEKYPAALTFLAMAQQLDESPAPENLFRRAATRERLGRQLMAAATQDTGTAGDLPPADVRAMLADAAQDFLAHARMTTLNDEQSGASLWKAGELFDLAGQTLSAAAVYEQFTIQRPRDPRVAEGLLALGRLYESAGMIDKAIAAYQRNLTENSRTPAAYASAVNLARCYGQRASRGAKPEDRTANFDKAEQLLLNIVQSADLQPTAREFRESLLALGDLYYANSRWSDAILRLDEVVARYPTDPAVPRTVFLLAESYRKSAAEIADALKDPATAHRSELERARAQRLLAAAHNFARVIELLDALASADVGTAVARRLSPLEQQYVRSSYMNRAECYYLRGEYEQAIKWYDEASARFSEEVLAAQAYVQIVNSYLALKQPAQAVAAAERGRWILKRIPDAAFGASGGGGQGPTPVQFEKLLALNKP